MLQGLLHLISRRPIGEVLIDLLDLFVVAWVIYRALLVLRGTRAMQMGMGLGLIFLVYFISKWAGFITLFNLLSSLLSSIILVVIVVFQNDIRRGLMRVGAQAFLTGMARQQESRVIDEVVAAATDLARHRMGALICFEQDANLDEFVVSQGTTVDSAVQRDLLVSIFVPEGVNKLHDGAVVIRNLRVAKAGVFFPMPDNRMLDKSLGSRHRAALGITEETDAVVVVVSEERGTISFCFNGNIVSNLDGPSLKQALLGLFGQRGRKKKPLTKRPPAPTTTGRVVIPQAGAAPKVTATGSLILTPAAGSARITNLAQPTPLAPSHVTADGPIPTPRNDGTPPPSALAPRPVNPAPPIDSPMPMPRSTHPPPSREPGSDD